MLENAPLYTSATAVARTHARMAGKRGFAPAERGQTRHAVSGAVSVDRRDHQMVSVNDVVARLNQHVSVVLTVAEASLPPERFRAFRKFVLDSFGWNGLAGELRELERSGKAK